MLPQCGLSFHCGVHNAGFSFEPPRLYSHAIVLEKGITDRQRLAFRLLSPDVVMLIVLGKVVYVLPFSQSAIAKLCGMLALMLKAPPLHMAVMKELGLLVAADSAMAPD